MFLPALRVSQFRYLQTLWLNEAEALEQSIEEQQPGTALVLKTHYKSKGHHPRAQKLQVTFKETTERSFWGLP